MRLGVIGGGAMGEAIISAVLARGLVEPSGITVAEKVGARARSLAETYGVTTASEAEDASGADIILLAVKPQDFGSLSSLAGKLGVVTTAVSIMAGVPIATIARVLGHSAIVRAMPNTPAQVGEGMTLWMSSPEVPGAAAAQVEAIFAALGRQARVTEEKYLDMATGVSGSGPGFVLLFIEAMIDAAVHVGFSRDLATEMVLQTVAGTAKLAQQSGKHPAELRAMVTSPAGTTAEGLRELEAGGLRAAVLNAVEAAYNKSRSMGGQGSQK
jgi:pyrroline-5-carboxylate reductase